MSDPAVQERRQLYSCRLLEKGHMRTWGKYGLKHEAYIAVLDAAAACNFTGEGTCYSQWGVCILECDFVDGIMQAALLLTDPLLTAKH